MLKKFSYDDLKDIYGGFYLAEPDELILSNEEQEYLDKNSRLVLKYIKQGLSLINASMKVLFNGRFEYNSPRWEPRGCYFQF